jgi:ribonuclease Z
MQTPDRVRVIPLGTSAGRPTLSRAASALAIATDGAWILCDCGEGAQLTALRAGLSLSRLDAVLVTHLHGDHFNGLPGLLGTLGLEGRERPIVVVGPRGIAGVLEMLGKAGAIGTGNMPVKVIELSGPGASALDWPVGAASVFHVVFHPLVHRVATFGYRVSLPDRPGSLDADAAAAAGVPRGPLMAELKAGRSVELPSGKRIHPGGFVGPTRRGPVVAYVLDCVPCEGAVVLGRLADVLVHESTYEHARAALAHERGHTTGVEAARIARDARARTLLLTHFSPSVEPESVAEEARAEHQRVVAAADLSPIEVGPVEVTQPGPAVTSSVG